MSFVLFGRSEGSPLQMKIIHNSGFTPDEIAMMRPLVISNVIECARILCLGA
jgi:hypothetical protein